MPVTKETMQKFLQHTDETGRFIVTSTRTGVTYVVEPQGTHRDRKWGSINPGSDKLMNKKGAGKYTGATDPEDSLITEENGFENIETLDKGVSPFHAIKLRDAKYPDKA